MFQPGQYWMVNPVIGTAESKEKRTPYVFIEGDISHIRTGTDADGGATFEPVLKPERRTVFMYMTEKSFPYTSDRLDALGWNGDFKNPELSEENKPGIWVDCSHEMYNQQPKERWNLPGGGGIDHAAPSSDVIRKLNAMYKDRKKSSGAAAPKAKAPTPAPVGGAADPIPFDAVV